MRFEILGRRSLWRSTLASAAVGIALLAVTTPLFAQKARNPSWVFEAFAARKDPLDSPLFGGIGISKYHRMLGLRLRGAGHFDGGSTETVCGQFGGQAPSTVKLTAWAADADLILEPLRVIPILRSLLLGFSPYGFVGIGEYGQRVDAGPDSNITTLSYGAGVHHDLIGPLGIQAEARYRQPLDGSGEFAPVVREKLVYSIGLRVGFGGKKSKSTKTTPTTTKTPSKTPPATYPPPRGVSEASVTRFASTVLDLAESYIDKPYSYGGASPYGGFDGAGFVQYVFARAGVRLPRTARQISSVGETVSLRVGSLRPGDLLFFANDGSNVDHVAIYAGHERFIHSSASGGGVRYDVLGEGDRGRWFAEHLVTACRISGGDTTQPTTQDPSGNKSLDPPDVAPTAPRAPR